MSTLPCLRPCELRSLEEDRRWLVEDLWSEEAVGIVGGEPKCCKSFLALDLAVAVASGAPCLRRFAVPRMGRVLLFAAEEALHVVRCRIEGVCRAAGVVFEDLDIQVITVPVLRLDQEEDRRKLTATAEKLKPKLLVLDPFVRLHRIDENAAFEVAPLLSYLRHLGRQNHLAVVVVHHARKNGGHVRAGQALRGSSEFHAWGDSNLYLRRRGDQLLLSAEHRAAPAMTEIQVGLVERAMGLALEVTGDNIDPHAPRHAPSPEPDASARILEALASAARPLTLRDLRALVRIRTATLCDVLAQLVDDGRVSKSHGNYAAETK